MNSSGRKVAAITLVVAVFCFTIGFTTAHSIQETNWLGRFVHGVWAPVPEANSFKVIPLKDGDPQYYSIVPMAVDSIVIGLREDGVVVWKKADDSSE